MEKKNTIPDILAIIVIWIVALGMAALVLMKTKLL